MSPARILILAGTTAAGSPCSRLAGEFSRELAFLDADVTQVSLVDYPLPLRDADGPAAVPPAAARLRAIFRGHRTALIITSQEGGSIPALLKNALEWLEDGTDSGFRPLADYICAIAGISRDRTGAAGAIAHLRTVLAEGFSSTLVGSALSIGDADSAFDEKGRLDNPRDAMALRNLTKRLVQASERLAPEMRT
jgi:chromate reductase, NAD(P)H dehydrogenase (quinone)